jgi:hypothetical protein
MFNFKSKKLNPVTRELVQKYETAAAIENLAERVEALMLLKDEVKEKLDKLSRRENNKILLGVGGAAASSIASLGAGIAASFIYGVKKIFNSNRAGKDQEVLLEKINSAISDVSESNLEAALASPAFVKALKSSFKKASEPANENYAEIVMRTAPKPPKATK